MSLKKRRERGVKEYFQIKNLEFQGVLIIF
jgi:hypothetical protein